MGRMQKQQISAAVYREYDIAKNDCTCLHIYPKEQLRAELPRLKYNQYHHSYLDNK